MYKEYIINIQLTTSHIAYIADFIKQDPIRQAQLYIKVRWNYLFIAKIDVISNRRFSSRLAASVT